MNEPCGDVPGTSVAGNGNLARWALSFALAVIFTTFNIQASLRSGVLALPPTYDDVAYFNEAIVRLKQMDDSGGMALVSGYLANPPHAPLQTLLAFIGFALLRPAPWAADAMNALPLALILRLFFEVSRRIRLYLSAIIALGLLGAPIFGLLIVEFRPDALCALLTATAVVIIIFVPEWRYRTAPGIWTGLLLAAALLAKPTLAPVTVALVGSAAVGVVFLTAGGPRGSIGSGFRAALLTAAIGGLLAAPHFLLAWRSLSGYIYENAFGTQAATWTPAIGGAFDYFTYYLAGPGGRAGVGPWLWFWLGIAPLAIVIAAREFRSSEVVRLVLSFLVVGLLAWIAVTIPGIKSPFIGLGLPALILSSIAVALVSLVFVMSRHGRVLQSGALASAVVAFSAVAWIPPAHLTGRLATPPKAYVDDQNRIVSTLADKLAEDEALGQKRLYVPIIAAYINPDTLTFALLVRGATPPQRDTSVYWTDMVLHKALAQAADYAIIFSADSAEPLDWLPSYKLRVEINGLIERSPEFEPVISIDSRAPGGTITLYRRRSAPSSH